MYMPLICPNYGGYLPFTSLLQEVSGLLYSTSTAKFGSKRLPNRFLGPAELRGLEINRMWSVGRFKFLHLVVQRDVPCSVAAFNK